MSGGTQSERQVQRAILQMCGLCFPSVFIHHSPNGAFLGSNPRDRAIRGGALKGDGTKAGFPDLICIWNGGTAYIEVKRPKGGTTSEDQKRVQATLQDLGWPVGTAKSPEDAHAFLKACGAPCRGELS